MAGVIGGGRRAHPWVRRPQGRTAQAAAAHSTLYRHMADGSAANTNTFSVSLAEGHGLGSLRSCHAPRPCQAGVLATFSTTYIYLYLTASNVSGCVSASYHLNCRLIHGGYNVYTLDTMYHPCRVAAAAPSQQQLRCSSSSVAAAAPSQQQLRRSSSSVAAAAPSQQQ